MKRLKMAVIGVGFWGRNHVRVLDELTDVELIAVCDVNRERAKAVSEKYGLNHTEKAWKCIGKKILMQ